MTTDQSLVFMHAGSEQSNVVCYRSTILTAQEYKSRHKIIWMLSVLNMTDHWAL